jgi:phage gp16-like protein
MALFLLTAPVVIVQYRVTMPRREFLDDWREFLEDFPLARMQEILQVTCGFQY